MARALGCHRSTISREFARNSCRYDGCYRYSKASERANGRRSRSRRNSRFSAADWRLVESLLALQWSPEQIAGRLKQMNKLSISHETIYRRIWRDKARGGALHTQLRGAQKRRRKRYGKHDSIVRRMVQGVLSNWPEANHGFIKLIFGFQVGEGGDFAWRISTYLDHVERDSAIAVLLVNAFKGIHGFQGDLIDAVQLA
jgi:hypothetical protein